MVHEAIVCNSENNNEDWWTITINSFFVIKTLASSLKIKLIAIAKRCKGVKALL